MRTEVKWIGIVLALVVASTAVRAQTNTFPASGSVGIGTTNPGGNLDIESASGTELVVGSGSNYSTFLAKTYSNTDWQGNYWMSRRYRGTGSSPAAVQLGDTLGVFDAWGFDGSASQRSAQIVASVSGAPSSVVGPGKVPGQISLWVANSGGIMINPFSVTSDGNGLFTGNVGIGTISPGSKLDVEGGSILVGSGSLNVPGGGDGTNPALHFMSFAPAGFNPGGNIGIWLANNGLINTNAGIQINSGGLTFSGATGTQTTPWTGVLCGGDYAEAVNAKGSLKTYEPGDVLVIGDDADGEVQKSVEPYSTMVAGIFATKPGVIGRRQTLRKEDEELPMAMIGIVPTKVTTENGPIHRGDLLVTSSTIGYAMKGTDRSRLVGAVIGKAMGSLDSGTGVIEVLVTLQ